jgi:hypothetical protein
MLLSSDEDLRDYRTVLWQMTRDARGAAEGGERKKKGKGSMEDGREG